MRPDHKLSASPFYDSHGELVCPFHMYRSSTDIRPVYGSVLVNLNTIPALAEAKLSVPGCWAYPDSKLFAHRPPRIFHS